MTRPDTGRAQDAQGPGLQWPQASPAQGRPLAPASLPARFRAAALLGLALLAAAPPAQAAKPVLRTTNPVTFSGSNVSLHYDQTLASTKTPFTTQYTVTVGGQSVAVTAVTVGGTEVRVFVGFHIAPDEAVTIAYSKPTGTNSNDPIQNSAGEEADSFSAKTATTSETWSATAFDAAASETSIAGHVVALRFTAALDSSPAFPVPASAFTVTVDGTAQTPGARQYIPSRAANSKGLIALQTLPTAIKSGQTVQVSYAPPLGAAFTVSRNRLWGSDDKLVQRFTTQTITNNTALVANTTKGTQSQRTFSFDLAQAFTTGSRAIRLDAAYLRVSKGTGRDDPDYTASIHSSNASDQPGDSLGTLTNPDALPTTPGSTRFEAPSAGITLAAATTYFVVIDVTVDGNQNFAAANLTDSDDEDDGKTTDWSIADAVLTRGAGHTNWGADAQARSLVIGVQGAPAAPTLASAAVNGTALTLTFNAKLAAGSVPAASAFTVSGGRTGTGTVTINSTDPRVVSVTLDSAVAHGQTVTVSYTKPASSPLKDTGTGTGALAALEVATFSGKAVKNATPEPGTLVSNTGQTASGAAVSFGVIASINYVVGQLFTTGGNAAGYTLSAVDAVLNTGGASPNNVQVSIYTTSGSPPAPDSSLHVLNNPSSLTDGGTNTFTAAEGASLEENKTYAVVFEITSGGDVPSLRLTDSDNEDSGGATGWSIANKRHQRQGTGSWTQPSGSGVPLIAITGTEKTLVITPPPNTQNPQDPQQPQDQSGEAAPFTLRPQPLQLALWTDQSAYRAGETVRLYHTVDPHDDSGRYRTFLYLEPAGGGERRYLAPLTAGELHPEPVDRYGIPAEHAPARGLTAADRTLSWEGEAPAPGLWRFVLELRPGAPEEQFEEPEEPLVTRRAWASFTVAESSLLLNRRGFDREVRSDATLRSDTIYYLGHRLFVRDGATLTIEPGTHVRAWGRTAAIIVEPGGRIVAEGTRAAPVVLACSLPVGQREPGCWGGLRILGRAPVTRLEGVAPGGRAVYGGTDEEDSSGVLRYVRVEFAGAADEPEDAGPAIGLYGAGSDTVLDHVQARQSLEDGFAFHGGTAVCGHCVASGSGNAGLSWERGWRGGASHLYVHHGERGVDGLVGGNDEEGHDLEPRSLPTLSNVTLLHGWSFGRLQRKGVAVRLRTGSGLIARNLLATRFFGGAIEARGRSGLLFEEGESSVTSALLYLNGVRPLKGGIQEAVEFISRRPKLRDVRWFANPDPRPKADSLALPEEGEGYIGAFGREENWLEEWTVFGPESAYDLRERSDDEE